MGLIRKLRNRLFQNLEFCIHDATLGADLASCGCRIDMVDGALERVDVACFNPNIEIVSWCLFLLENGFEFEDFLKFTSFLKRKKTLSNLYFHVFWNIGNRKHMFTGTCFVFVRDKNCTCSWFCVWNFWEHALLQSLSYLKMKNSFSEIISVDKYWMFSQTQWTFWVPKFLNPKKFGF